MEIPNKFILSNKSINTHTMVSKYLFKIDTSKLQPRKLNFSCGKYLHIIFELYEWYK